MGRKRLAAIIAFVTVLGGIPAVGAEHLSVGYEDAVGVQAEESPTGKSVPDDVRDRGLKTDCFEADGSSTDPGQFQQAAESDPFCGHMVYHDDVVEMRQESPPDQDLRSISTLDIGTFDVRTTRSYMAAHEARLIRNDVSPCAPFCEDTPGGNITWNAVHTVGEEAGLTHGPDEADSNERDDRLQLYGADVHTLTARYLLEEADTHEMNGWYVPGVTRSFVAFLYDDGGHPIGEQKLSDALANASGEELPNDAVASVCGFTPDADFVGTGGSFTCEVPFEYEEQSSMETDFKQGYHDKCESPTYVCGAQAGGAWYANFDCLCGTFAETDYVRWHWVVAPDLPDCGVREPGFVTDSGSNNPYLAHDVDVFTNSMALQATDATHGVPALTATGEEIAVEQSEQALNTLPGAEGGTVQPPTSVSKDDKVEPNADPVGALADTSQSMPEEHPNGQDLFRDSACDQIAGDEEPATMDPWVDIVDGKVTTWADGETEDADADDLNVSVSDVSVQARPGYYDNDAGNQDDDNHPGPDLYVTDGNVGLFTDKNDDGDYDTIAGDTVWFSDMKTSSASIEEVGAYPMLWDVRVQADGSGGYKLDTTSGCQVSGTTLTDGAQAAGFGADTALFQAVYLSEPTTFTNPSTGEAVPYPGGENIYVFLSQSARAHWDGDLTANANDVDGLIDDAVTQLRGTVAPADADLVVPGDEFGYASDYKPQCPEDTGGFTLDMAFTHSCQLGCEGDTIVTGYTFQLTEEFLGGSEGTFLPVFTVNGEKFSFGSGQYTWTDVDPFDNDPSRQDDSADHPPIADE